MDMIDDTPRHSHTHTHVRDLPCTGFTHDVSQNMLVEIFRAVPRMQAQLEHIEASVDSTRRHVESLGRRVENLTSWKHRILGGVAVLAFLWAGVKLLSDYVHISVGRDAVGTPMIAPAD